MYSPVVDSAFEVSFALHRTTTWRWRLAERHVRLTVRRLKQGDDDNDVAAVHQPLAVVAALEEVHQALAWRRRRPTARPWPRGPPACGKRSRRSRHV